MKLRFRGKLTYANVVATIALFLVLTGGAAYAASHLGKNSVGSKQLKKSSVTTAKIKNGAVTGSKIEISSLGTVPSATHADQATSATQADKATSATHADKATSANQADSATSAQNAASLGGVAAGQYVTPQSVLQSGQTETGVFGAGDGSTTGFLVAAINFIPKAPAAIDLGHAIYVPEASGSASHCPGISEADPGYLCAYGSAENFVSFVGFYRPDSTGEQGATTDGTTIYLSPASAEAYVRGMWAYTAP
jgi:hypothetical protein